MSEGATPFSRIGGEPAVRRLVKRFYQLTETLPGASAMRHRDDPPAA